MTPKPDIAARLRALADSEENVPLDADLRAIAAEIEEIAERLHGKCSQYWNEHDIPEAETHAALDAIYIEADRLAAARNEKNERCPTCGHLPWGRDPEEGDKDVPRGAR